MLRKIIKVFLASPGDLKVEREAAHRIVNELNRQSAGFWNAQFELVGWEDTVTRFGRAQELINQELDQCELFLGLIWQKWGSPPGGPGHPYTSGFEEEYQRSLSRRTTTGSPEMSLLFKTPEEGRLQDPGKELQKVLAFKKAVIESKSILFQEFSKLDEFEHRVRTILIDYVQGLIVKGRQSGENTDVASPTSPSNSLTHESSPEAQGTIPTKAVEFLNSIVTKNARGETISPTEVARFRLISCAIAQEGNDDETLGVHDANIIYENREPLDLTPPETAKLVNAGLKSFHHENTPLWTWLNSTSNPPEKALIALSFSDDINIKKNSIKCLNLCGYNLDAFNGLLDRHDIVGLWFKTEIEEVKAEALDYLAAWGEAIDLEHLLQHVEDSNQAVAQKALRAVVMIKARYDVEDAAKFLIESTATSISEELVSLVFSRPAAIRTEILEPGAFNRSTEVRRACIHILCHRNALSANNAQILLDDPEPRIRGEVLDHLLSKGRSFTLADAKKILVKKSPRPRFGGLLSMFTAVETEGHEFFEAHLKKLFRKYPLSALKSEAEAETGESFLATETLYTRDYSAQFQSIAANLGDDFAGEFQRRLRKLRELNDPPDDAAVNFESRADQIRSDMRNKTLRVVCEVGGPEALPVVRSVLDRGDVEYSDCIVRYLEKFGGWEDIQRLVKLAERPSLQLSLLYFNHEEEKRVAKAILGVGRQRPADLAALEISGSILAYVIADISAKSFASLDDPAILNLLSHESSQVRKCAALKAVVALPKARLRRVLTRYLQSPRTHYYNAVFWLDLGTAAPAAIAKRVATAALI